MIDRTLRRLSLVAVLALGGCTGSDTSVGADAAAPDPGGWRLASGKTPSKAEFGALAATCQDKGGAFESCLSNLGLKRAQ
jgi:hypothetical protein